MKPLIFLKKCTDRKRKSNKIKPKVTMENWLTTRIIKSELHPKLRIFCWIGDGGEIAVVNLLTGIRKFESFGKVEPKRVLIVPYPKHHSKKWFEHTLG